jgi:micrococcal nuclease
MTIGVLLLAAAVAAPPSQRVDERVGRSFEAVVVRIADGDTLELVPIGDQGAIRIRLEGIDAPETGEAFSREAQAFLRALVINQRVRVDGRDVDRYGRLVARVAAAGKDASMELVRAGLACHRFAPDSRLSSAEAAARAEGAGFWSTSAKKPGCVTGRPPPPRRATTPAPTTPNSNAAAGRFRGNVSSHLYHAATCPNFNCRNCTRMFISEAEAQAAGFKPAGDCLK